MQTLTLASPDGPRLGARLFRPSAGQRVKAAVLIGGAMGVRPDYHQPFARWLASQGTRVLVDCYANAPRRIERIAPADVHVKRIGHFGFFRDQFQSSLWARTAALLQGSQLLPRRLHESHIAIPAAGRAPGRSQAGRS